MSKKKPTPHWKGKGVYGRKVFHSSIEDFPKVKEDPRLVVGTDEWSALHSLIYGQYVQFWVDHKRFPTDGELAKLFSVPVEVITSHIQHIDLVELQSLQQKQAALLLNGALVGIYNRAAKGDASAVNLLREMAYEEIDDKPENWC